uniref:Uncharacterized protein n=1 Tax=Siphoviridae sp. ctX581 TaxID=2826365 RepID=A0A8S5ME51_9CAUD|nr:MAG TPA: hypothetical protein [Siphoviridae sp. ctX581]
MNSFNCFRFNNLIYVCSYICIYLNITIVRLFEFFNLVLF